MERIGFNTTMNAGAIKWNGKYLMMVRVEGADRKSFFAIAESPDGIDGFRFWPRPVKLPDTDPDETNVYDIRLTAHEDGWIYGVFCSERHHPDAAPGDLSTAQASAGIVRTKDFLYGSASPTCNPPASNVTWYCTRSSWTVSMLFIPVRRTISSWPGAAAASAGRW